MAGRNFLTTKICSQYNFCDQCILGSSSFGVCEGCGYSYSLKCVKKYCNLTCSRCGSNKKPYKNVYGVCGRVSVLDSNNLVDLNELFNYEIKSCYSSSLPIQTLFIPVLDKDIRKFNIPDCFPELDTWCVQLHDVFSIKKRKFLSGDIKDYLSLANDKKLILSTNSTDNYQELLWEKRLELDFAQLNFDYWFPGHFSIYDNDSKMYQLVNAKRQQVHSELSKSQFVWFRLGENIPLVFMKPIQTAKNILISTNNMKTPESIEILHNEIIKADDFFPIDANFFVIGGVSNFPKIKSGRKYYIIGTQWCKTAMFGRDINRNLYREYTKDQKKEMLLNNLSKEVEYARKNYTNLYGRRAPTGFIPTQGKFQF